MAEARLLFHRLSAVITCHMTLYEPRNPDAMPPYPEVGEHPSVRVGSGAIMVATRCPDAGDVRLEVWAGEPGLEASWQPAFDSVIETVSNGFNVGDVGDTYQINAPPGRYRVRADTRRDQRSEVEAVRFVFPNNPDLTGSEIQS